MVNENIGLIKSSKKLRLRILKYVLVVSTLITSIAIALHLYSKYSTGVDEMNQELDILLDSAVENITLSVWNFDDRQLQLQLDGIMQSGDVAYVSVDTIKPSGDIASIERVRDLKNPESVRTHKLTFTDSRNELHHLGELTVKSSNERVVARVREQFVEIVVFQATKTFMISFFILLILSRILTKHVEEIAKYMHKVSMHNLSIPLALNRKTVDGEDELDELVDAINNMRLRLIYDLKEKGQLEEELVSEKLKSLEVKKAAEFEKTRTKAQGVFLAMVSHEIRTPLNGIIGSIDLLEKEVKTREGQENLEILKVSSEFLMDIVDDVLDVAKMESRQICLDKKYFNLNTMLVACFKTFRPKLKSGAVDFIFINDDIYNLEIDGDSSRIRQIFYNLVSNAIKFTEGGVVTVSVLIKPKDNGFVNLLIDVEDTGIGISPEIQPRIFDKFVQDEHANSVVGGTGLGLAICKNLVGLMSGELALKSELNEGSKFSIRLPVEARFSDKAQQLSMGNGNVAILGFSEKSIDVYRTQLSNAGFEVSSYLFSEVTLDNLADYGSKWLVDFGGRESEAYISSLQRLAMHLDSLLVVSNDEAPSSIEGIIWRQKPVSTHEVVECLINGEADLSPVVQVDTASKLNFGKLVILLVDDNAININVGKSMLVSLGVTVLVARNGRQAVEVYQKEYQAISMIFMDYEMPELNGLQASAEIRDFEINSGLPRTPIVTLSAHALDEYKDKSEAAGIEFFLTKPLRMTVLRDFLSDQNVRNLMA